MVADLTRKVEKMEKANSGNAKTNREKKQVPKVVKSTTAGGKRAAKLAQPRIEKLQSILTKPEEKTISEYMVNMLEPTRPFKLCRPIPVRSVACQYGGEIKIESQAEYVEVKMRPDPLAFIDVTTQIGESATVNQFQAVENLASLITEQRQSIVFTPEQWVCFQMPLTLASGGFIRPDNQDISTATGEVVSIFDGQMVPFAQAYAGIRIEAGGTLTWSVVNNGNFIVQYTARVSKKIRGNLNAEIIATGNPVQVGANAAGSCTVLIPNAFLPGEGDQLIFEIGCKTVNANNTCPWRTQEFAPSFLGFSAADAYVTTSYTLGEAIYGKGKPNALVLDSFFRESFLWSPIGASLRVNIKQQLNEFGGMFQNSYLPSFIVKILSAEPSVAWNQIAGYSRSYPVKETDFKDGGHASWVGARIQDYEFRKPIESYSRVIYEESSMPWVSVTSQKAGNTSTSAKYFINFLVAFEVQTLNPLVTATVGPACPEFMAQFLAFIASNHNLVGENPSHMERIRKMVKKALTDPRFRDAAKWALKTGVPLIASVL